MEHGFPLARLAQFVAAARTRDVPTRLVVRNTERFGLLHLYFRGGRLVHLEGHLADPVQCLTDLGTWRYGVVRQDEIGGAALFGPLDPALDPALDRALRRLEAQGVVQPDTTWPQRVTPAAPAAPAAYGPPSAKLPALSMDTSVRPRSQPYAAHRAAAPATRDGNVTPAEPLTVPQWQMVALVVHQVVAHVGAEIGAQMAVGLLQQALAREATRGTALAAELTLDASGWLQLTRADAIARYSGVEVAEQVAALLASFETRCASLTGSEQAHQLIAQAAEPFRMGLAQLGLDISA
jgi:hypothetical protein